MWKASDFERLDPRLFRGFLAVMRAGSMSEAARVANLTQGAISQQIAKLDDRLGAQLFLRTADGIMPTESARMLTRFAENYLQASASFLEQLNLEYESMNGWVRYAMPESCIHSPHFPMLLQRRKQFPDIELDVHLQSTELVYRSLLAGEVDFGFVLDRRFEAQVDLFPFCVEKYGLVASPDLAPQEPLADVQDLQQTSLIWFPQAEHYLTQWIEAVFRQATDCRQADFNVRGSCSDLRGALAMMRGGLGMGVIPLHVVQTDIDAGTLCHVPLQPQQAQASCQIYIATPKNSKLPARVRRVIRWFLEMHADLQPIPSQFLQ